MPQRVHEEIGVLAAIEPELHLCEISRQMLGADSMPRSNNATLEQRERRFYGVRVDVSVNIDLRFVLYGLVSICEGSALEGGWVGVQFVRYDDIHILADRFADIFRQSPGLHVLRMEETQVAAPLPNADYDLFFAVAVSGFTVSLFTSTNVGFVHFYSAIHHGQFYVAHGCTNAMAEIPRRLVAHPESAFDLICAHAFSGLAEKKNRHEPRFQRKVRVVEDGLCQDAELIAALNTLEFFLSLNLEHALALAAQALHSERPAQLLQQSAALFVRGEHLSEVGKSHA